MKYLFSFILALNIIACAPRIDIATLEREYVREDSVLWASYELESERLMEQYAEDEDSLYIMALELEAMTDRKNRELALEYSSTPSGLRRCFMLRLEIAKDTLRNIITRLPRKMRKTDSAQAIAEHIQTDQIVEGMDYHPFDGIDAYGHGIAWERYSGKNLLLIYGGLGCMGASGRSELAELYDDYSPEVLEIMVYWPVESLEELQKLQQKYPANYSFVSEFMPDYSPFKVKYGVQAMPTCFLIGRNGKVLLKTVGFDSQAIRTNIE